ncbi:hypothetical protein C8R42DRAFT_645663 [Lentinula raphanica]|nr:hypothetical protein C8R42DRAFT_645663 [Lentinula raphanica]
MTRSGTGKKKDKGPELPSISWSDNNRALSFALITEVEKEENRVVFLGKRKGGKTSGDSKAKAGKRIAAAIIPDLYAINPTNATKRCLDHWDALVKKYKDHAKRLRKTGEGVQHDDEEIPVPEDQEKDEYLDSYVGPGGPDETTTDRVRNIWEEIIQEFPVFPRLHALLAARANITPPQLTTGVGPAGRTVLHLQLQESDDSETVHPRPSASGSFAFTPDSQPSTPLASTSYGNTTLPASSTSVSNAIAKARANQSRPQKRSVEDRLFDMHSDTLRVSKKAKQEALLQSRRDLAFKERDQLIRLTEAGLISPNSAKVKLQAIDASANSTLLDSSPPSSPTRQGSSRDN